MRMRAPGGSPGRREATFIRFPVTRRAAASLRFHLGVFNDHIGDVVLDGIDAAALGALQTLPVGRELNGQLTRRAN